MPKRILPKGEGSRGIYIRELALSELKKRLPKCFRQRLMCCLPNFGWIDEATIEWLSTGRTYTQPFLQKKKFPSIFKKWRLLARLQPARDAQSERRLPRTAPNHKSLPLQSSWEGRDLFLIQYPVAEPCFSTSTV